LQLRGVFEIRRTSQFDHLICSLLWTFIRLQPDGDQAGGCPD
jgi:hypothetical protein